MMTLLTGFYVKCALIGFAWVAALACLATAVVDAVNKGLI